MNNLTYEMIKKAVKQLKKGGYRSNYYYRYPSPNYGKMLVIYGPVGPMQAAEMITDVWYGKSKVEDCPYMREVEIENIIYRVQLTEERQKDDQGI